MDKNSLFTIAHGVYGATLLQVTSLIDPTTLDTIFKLALQIVIAAVTLFNLFKKKKDS